MNIDARSAIAKQEPFLNEGILKQEKTNRIFEQEETEETEGIEKTFSALFVRKFREKRRR
jgi:hypothetical protein